jgi:hypothetical protein
MKIGSVIAAALLLIPANALSQGTAMSGNEMYKPCKNSLIEGNTEDVIEQGACIGVLNTVYYFGPHLPDAIKFCPPKGSSSGQAAKIVNAYMDSHPEVLHKDLRLIAVTALQRAWPC